MAGGPPDKERRASPRLLGAAAAVCVLVAIAIVLGVVLTGGSDDSEAGETTATEQTTSTAETTSTVEATPLPQAVQVRDLLTGIPQDANELGDPDAPVTMVEYVDIQCPYCASVDTKVLPALITRFVRTGKLKLQVRPLAGLGADSERGRAIILAAGNQGKLFDIMHLLYLNQGAENSGWLEDELVDRAAASVRGLDAARLKTDSNSDEVGIQANGFLTQAAEDSVQVTPTILVGKSGTELTRVQLTSADDPTAVVQAIEKALG